MKYLLTILALALTSVRAFAAAAPDNDAFAKASAVTDSSSALGAGALTVGETYIITSVGTTDFKAVGADANLVGAVFVATGLASGTGTVGTVTTVTGTSVGATSETGEPVHGTVGSGHSVWWKWTPSVTGTATIDTAGSAFDTVLAVYKGDSFSETLSVSELVVLAYSDDLSSSDVTSKVSFTVVQGTTYYIAVDGFGGGARGDTGLVNMHLVIGPGTYIAQNDDYADRAVIAGEYAVAKGSSELATLESGEALINYNSYYYLYYNTMNSVWWSWTAPRSGKVTITADMEMVDGYGWLSFYGNLALFSGTSDDIKDLVYLAADEEGQIISTGSASPSLARNVTEGDVLQIRLSDYPSSGGSLNTLTVSMDAADLSNDHFAKRKLLSGSAASATISNVQATAQVGEPAHYEEVTAGNFVIGQRYMINSLGTTIFSACSVEAVANVLGTEFTASGVGSGTGTALHLRPLSVRDSSTVLAVTEIEAGKLYSIATVGNSDWQSFGSNGPYYWPFLYIVGDIFKATGVGTGTGTVYLESGLLTLGKTYRIEYVGSTDFRDMGASYGTVGETFTAKDTGFGDGTGYGSGTVIPVDVIPVSSIVAGRNYRIESLGTTVWSDFGVSGAAVGTNFQVSEDVLKGLDLINSGTGTVSTPTASKSVWWTWTAPSNGYLSLDTRGSAFDTLLKVYKTATGVASPALSDLIPVPLASQDDRSSTDSTSFVHFKVDQGVSYQIAVDSGSSIRKGGNLLLGLHFTPDYPIITTQVQNQIAYIGGTAAAFTVYNTGAAAIYDWQVKTPGSTTWLHVNDGVTTAPDLPNGIAASTLTLSVTQPMNGNQYRCIITNIAGQVTSKAATLTAVYLTTYQGGTPTNTDLGIAFSPPLGATSVIYYAKGLPAGLSINSATGEITGRISARPNINYTINYWMTYVLAGTKTKSAVLNAVILVNPCPSTMTGGYEGLLLDGAVPSGKVSIVVNSAGGFTGKLTYKGVVYSLRDALALDDVGAPTYGDVTLNLGSSLHLWIKVTTDSAMTATLTDGLVLVGDVDTGGVQVKTYSQFFPAPWAGTYTLAFTDPDVGGPEGSGYATAMIDFKGALVLKGKLADGTVITSLAPTNNADLGSYRLFVPLYANKLGFIGGGLSLHERSNGLGYNILPNTSTIYWKKAAVANDKAYPAGFGPIAVDAVMEPWRAPTKSFLIGPLGLLTSDSQTIGNFDLQLKLTSVVDNISGGNPESLPTNLKLDSISRVSVLNPSNPTGFVVNISPKTGLYSGSFTLSDKRKVKFEGILLQFETPPSDAVFGRGFFSLPPVPLSGGSILSGDVQFIIP